MLVDISNLRASCANSSSSSSSSSNWLFVTEETGVGGLALVVGLESLGLELFTSVGLTLEELASVEWALELAYWDGRGEPEAIASCFASKL